MVWPWVLGVVLILFGLAYLRVEIYEQEGVKKVEQKVQPSEEEEEAKDS